MLDRAMEDNVVPFVIGHHDSGRELPVTAQNIQSAHAANYDMVTCRVTNAHFHSRVLALLSSSLTQGSGNLNGSLGQSSNASSIHIPALSPADSPLTPDDTISQIMAVTSTWTDLCSPDPVIADLSRQILKLEMTYAAFCGINYVLIPGPRSVGSASTNSHIVQYARAILDALSQGPFMQIYIWLPMIDHGEDQAETIGDLAPFVREEFRVESEVQNGKIDIFGSWEAWNIVRSLCKYHPRLCVALSIPKLLPPVSIQSRWYSEPVRVLSLNSLVFTNNAKGYPVLTKPHQALISQFSKLRNPPWFLLCEVGQIPEPANSSAMLEKLADASSFPTPAEAFDKAQAGHVDSKEQTHHLSYMRNLQNKQPPQTLLERFGSGYQDYLQAPLQPLTVNLESITYEVFEKDPIKYEWYERAIARALHDWIDQGKPTSGPDGRVVVAVVGAGRGPLVTRALQAAEGVDVEIDMWALEKNPNAYVLLQRHNATIWDNRVNLVKSDMRTWRGPLRQSWSMQTSGNIPVSTSQAFTGDPEADRDWLLAANTTAAATSANYKIDILISELLGSFADNELSPECLDGVQHLLNPTHGISIPASYTAHLTPIAAPKLHADIVSQSVGNPSAPETPYVVMLNAIDYLSTTPAEPSPSESQSTSHSPMVTFTPSPSPPTPVIQTAWSFTHPNPYLSQSATPSTSTATSAQTTSPTTEISNTHNARSTTLTFPVPNRGTCHGLAGYFETILYSNSSGSQKVELSTNPTTMDQKSAGMISWFPIYFPLKIPIHAPDNSEIVVYMWRQTDDRKVWYEWMIEVYVVLIPDSLPGKEREGAAGTKGRRRVRISGSELHTSIKEGCLM